MVQRASEADPERDRAARQVALFSVLLHARQHNQFSHAADAQAELERSGILVKFRRPATRQGVADVQ